MGHKTRSEQKAARWHKKRSRKYSAHNHVPYDHKKRRLTREERAAANYDGEGGSE